MGRFNLLIALSLLSLFFFPSPTLAQLRQNFYSNICPNVESIVRTEVTKKFQQTFVTVPATLRLFFHDCFVQVILVFFNFSSIFVMEVTESFNFAAIFVLDS